MKNLFLFLIIVFMLSFANNVLAFDSKHAGFTSEGVFYVHNDLVKQAGYGAPTLQSSITGWGNDVVMELRGDYWVVSTGKKAFGPVLYAFHLGYSNMWLPHVLVDMGVFEPVERYSGQPENQVVPNNNFGYNFAGRAVARAPF